MRHATAIIFAQPDIENDLAALGVEDELKGMEAIQAIIRAMSTSRQKDTSLDYGLQGDGLEPSAPEPKEEVIRPRTAITYGRRP